MFRFIAIIAILAFTTLTACPAGCLKCITEDSQQKCEICDLTRFFYVQSDGSCKEDVQPNCLVPSLNLSLQKCTRCVKSYFYDELARSCVEVPSTKLQTGCLYYTPAAECSQCEGDMYVSSGKCVAVPTKVDKCLLYDGAGNCVECQSNYRRNEAGSECLAFEAIENCRIHTDYACQRCKSGFWYAFNRQLLSEATLQQVHNGLLTSNDRIKVENKLAEECVAQNILHCSEYDSYGRCKTCQNGYYSDPITGKCLLAKESEIFKCKVYQDAENCLECEEGYYLLGDKCEPRTIAVPNCKTLTPNAQNCKVCNDDWYIDNGNCLKREKSIHIFGCIERPINKDICSKCKEGMLKATDELKCFFPIPNCSVPKIPDSTGTLECTTCHNDTIPTPDTNNTTSCIVRNKPNCKIFASNHSDTCQTCHDNYFVSAGNCIPYTKKCKEREETSDNCKSCFSYQYLKKPDNTCHNYTVKNCLKENDNEDKCDTCLAEHYLDQTTFSCLKYNLYNCKDKDQNSNTCTNCNDGFFKQSATRCVPLDIPGCSSPNSSTGQCDTCNQGFYLNNGVCIPQKIPGCIEAQLSLTAATCGKCSSGFYLPTGNTECKPYTVTHCKDGQLSATEDKCNDCLDSFHKTAAGKCIPFTEWNCKTMDDNGVCTDCEDGYYLETNTKKCILKAKIGCKEFESNNIDCKNCKDWFYKSNGNCLPINIPNCVTAPSNAVDNLCPNGCKNNHYWDSSKVACLLKDIVGCSSYSNSTTAAVCSTAIDGYFKLNGSNVEINSLANCVQQNSADKSKCLKCREGYYPDTSGVCQTLTSKPNCRRRVANSNNCEQCKNLFYVNSGNCTAITGTANCVESDGKANSCTMCESQYKLTGTTNKTCTDVTNKRTVANCKGNNSGSDKNCTVCKKGYTIINSMKFARELPIHCEIMNNTNGTCTQVKEGFECTSNTDCFPIKDLNSLCIKLKPSKYVSIATAGECAKCRNYRTHYLTGGNCTARTSASKHCSIYNKTQDQCIACREGLQYKSSGSANNDCTESAATDNSTHCKATAYNAARCYECEDGYVVKNTDNSCVQYRSSEEQRCRVIDNSITNGPRCTICKEGFILDDKTCIKDETCYRDSNGDCKFCWEDYEPINGNTKKCAPKLNKDDCKFHMIGDLFTISGSTGACVRCKDKNKIPYNIFKSSATPKIKYYCKQNDFIDLKFNVYLQSGGTQYFKTVILPWENAIEITDMIQTSANTKALINASSADNIDDVFCLDIRIPKCYEYDTANININGIYPICKTCEVGFYLSTNSRFGQKCKRGNIAGCQIYEKEHQCKTCHNGYYLKTDTKLCIKYEDIPNCKVYESTNHSCARCLEGYVTSGGICVKSKEKNCLHFYYNENLCLQCQPNHYLENYMCKPYTIENCDVLQKTRDRCILCQENYYLNGTNGKCYKNTTKRCRVKSKMENKCVSCEEGLFQDASTSDCIEITISDCLQQDPENGKCLICEQGYYLTKDDTCQPYTLNHCKLFEPYEDRCLLCENNFYLNDFGVCLRHTIEHCKLLDPRRNSCLDCQSNAYILKNGTCQLYTVKNCNIFQRIRDGCLSCLPGFYIDSAERCLPYRFAKNCLILNPYRDECRECLPNHFMNINHCYKYTVNNCRVFKKDADICVDCKKGFFLEDNVCEPYTMNNCSEYSLNSNKCLGCHEGEYLEDGLCKPNTALFCTKKSSYSNTCMGCPDDFYLDSGVCLPRVKSTNCKRAFPTADLCDTCFATHYLAAGFCIAYGRETCKTFDSDKDLCTACETGKYWLSNHICEPYTVMNCKTPDPNKDKCNECMEGPYFLGSDNLCHASTIVANCTKYNKVKDECIECEERHYLHSKSECRKNPSGIYKCKHYSSNSTCSRCELGYYVFNNYCERSTLLIDNCFNYIEDGKCGECLPDYTLKDNSCFKHIEASCKTWEDSENCASCGVNQVLNKNNLNKIVCEVSGIDNCLEAVRENNVNRCTTCVQGMYPQGNECLVPESPITGCYRYESASICQECNAQYTLNPEKSGCFTNSDFLTPNCDSGQQFEKPICKVCSAGYLLEDGNKCIQCGGDGCNLCDPWNSQQCLMCSSGYDHDGVKCSKPTQAVERNGKSNKFLEKASSTLNIFYIFVFVLVLTLKDLV